MSIVKQLPFSHKEVIFRGMTGNEEDILFDEKKVKKGDAVNEILLNCIESLDGKKPTMKDILEFKAPDRLTLLVWIRQESYGDIIENAEITCRRCKHTNIVDIDLSELPYKESDTEEDTFTVAIDGKQVIFGHIDGKQEKKLLNIDKDLMTMGMLIRIKEVEGVHPNGIKKWLKGLPVKERNALRKAMQETDCGIDTEITLQCEECGSKIVTRVESLANFFFPQM